MTKVVLRVASNECLPERFLLRAPLLRLEHLLPAIFLRSPLALGPIKVTTKLLPPSAESRYNPKIELAFDTDLDFPSLPAPVTTRPVHHAPKSLTQSTKTQSTKLASSSIMMSEMLAVHSELETKFEIDMKEFKKEMSARLENKLPHPSRNLSRRPSKASTRQSTTFFVIITEWSTAT
jgi:hypothetical protein